jgi:hypothetical protein
MPSAPHCIALSFDSKFFYQGRECIRTIKRHCRQPVEICVLALRLAPGELEWLNAQGVVLRQDYDQLLGSADLPLYAYSQLCRPYLRELFPGFEIYMWVDADIRFVHHDAFDLYFHAARSPGNPVAICQESDGAYINVWSPDEAWGYHHMKNERLQAVYGGEVYRRMQYFYNFNTGIWAVHRDSTFWGIFKDELRHGQEFGFSHLREQDAMNVALLKWGEQPAILPSTMNWLCGLSVPEHNLDTGRFVRPVLPHEPISVMHLICSQSDVEINGKPMKWYELYRRLGFTE